ncbi:MAG: hypothetical protein AAFN18_21270 [Cyanobacteria bacterium J06554_6]
MSNHSQPPPSLGPEQQIDPSFEQFDQIVIADLGPFQIAVPTTAKLVRKPFFSSWLPVPERSYSSQGWLVYNGTVTARMSAVKLGNITLESSPLPPIQRLSPGIPVDFQSTSAASLPEAVAAQAMLACQLGGERGAYHAIFRQQVPKFVRIYPYGAATALAAQVKHMLASEAQFLAQNRHRLEQLPFYQAYFERSTGQSKPARRHQPQPKRLNRSA